MLSSKIFPLSIKTYGFIFIVVTILSFSSISLLSVYQVREINKASKVHNTRLALNEIDYIIDSFKRKTDKTASEFLQWDEFKQQFSNPTYYAYWHKSRMPSAAFLPSYFKTIELYDSQGKPFSAILPPAGNSDFNFSGDSELILQPAQNTVYQLIKVYDSKQQLTGYTTIEYSLSALLDTIPFRYIDKNTINYNSDLQEFRIDQLLQHINYQLFINKNFDDLQKVLFNSVINLALIGAFISFIIWLMISFFSGRPLQQLASHFDSLRAGEQNALLPQKHTVLSTAEYEKVRTSFNRFQKLLSDSEKALRFSESRLQSVLENIPVAIITFDEYKMIDSCNSAAEKIFKYKHHEIIGDSIDKLFDSDSRNICHYLVEKIITNPGLNKKETEQTELIGRRKDGSLFDLSLNISEVQFAGRPLLIAMLSDISDQKRSQERLEYMANYDSLTNLPNRILFHDRLHHALEHAHRKNSKVGLLFIDLDRFKIINDSLGHQIGDQLLIQTAKRIRNCIREGDTVARLGGDEFTIINEDILNTEESVHVAHRINAEIRKPFLINNQELFISTSIGITFSPDDATQVDELIKHADSAMYNAKDHGGDTYRLFTQELSHSANQRMLFENRLRQALDNNEFELYFQPRIDLNSFRITSMETLLRWRDDNGFICPPDEFIPILEDTGMILNVGAWAMRQACLQYQKWEKAGLPEFKIAINLSARQIKDKNFISTIQQLLAEDILPASQIEFEITESLLVEDIATTIQLLNELHTLGFSIAIDDFGTGYSSLSYLKNFPIDTLKIDKSFVENCVVNENDLAIIETIIAIANSLNMSITVEGVESEEQLELLKNRGCHEVQGYLFAKPMPADETTNWISSHQPSSYL